MINEQITQAIISSAKSQARLVFDIIRFMIYSKSGNHGIKNLKSGEVKLKDLIKTNSKLDKIEVTDAQLKYISKELKKNGVSFSLYFDKETNKSYIFFQAKDIQYLNLAFDKILNKLKNREKNKTNSFKETLKARMNRAKERFKEKFKDKIFDRDPWSKKL